MALLSSSHYRVKLTEVDWDTKKGRSLLLKEDLRNKGDRGSHQHDRYIVLKSIRGSVRLRGGWRRGAIGSRRLACWSAWRRRKRAGNGRCSTYEGYIYLAMQGGNQSFGNLHVGTRLRAVGNHETFFNPFLAIVGTCIPAGHLLRLPLNNYNTCLLIMMMLLRMYESKKECSLFFTLHKHA